MFVRASLVRSWFAALCLVRDSAGVAKRLSSSHVWDGEKTAKRRLEPLKENPDYAVPLDQYELPRSNRDELPGAPESVVEAEDDSDFDAGVFEKDDNREERLSVYLPFQRRQWRPTDPTEQPTRKKVKLTAYQQHQRRRPLPKKPAKRLTKLTVEDIPLPIQQLMWKRAKKLPVQVIIGNKGVNNGLLTSLHNHFRSYEVVKVSVCRRFEDSSRDVAQDLEKQSGAVVIHDGGRRMLAFRGFDGFKIPGKTPKGVREWWGDLKLAKYKKQAEREERADEESKGDG